MGKVRKEGGEKVSESMPYFQVHNQAKLLLYLKTTSCHFAQLGIFLWIPQLRFASWLVAHV
jgi:hypothetical protein